MEIGTHVVREDYINTTRAVAASNARNSAVTEEDPQYCLTWIRGGGGGGLRSNTVKHHIEMTEKKNTGLIASYHSTT